MAVIVGSVAGSAAGSRAWSAGPLRVALLGNPNTGKTTLFNRLCGLRHKISNFPGTTVEARVGRVRIHADAARGQRDANRAGVGGNGNDGSGLPAGAEPQPLVAVEAELIDLPGVYSLELEQLEAEVCRAVLAGRAAPRGDVVSEPSALCVVTDATNLPRSLLLVGEALRRRLPTVVAVNMIDLAQKRGVSIDVDGLEGRLGCPVVAVCARSGQGLDRLAEAMGQARISTQTPPGDERGLRLWAEGLYESVAGEPSAAAGAGMAGPRFTSGAGSGAWAAAGEEITDRVDRWVTHPVLGLGIFAGLMMGLFYLLFTLAAYPMDMIDGIFSWLGGLAAGLMPEGLLRDLLVEGVIAGIGSTVIFLPQICLLFFVISLLEDTGYLARAAFVTDRWLRPFGLPGHAFVPLLSSHACALPGIMATRTIPDARQRLAAILVAPFMSCSARLPVYALLTTVLFRDRPAMAAAAFVGCYAVGIAAGMLSALVARRTFLRGPARPMALELPGYQWPSLRAALLTTWDRGLIFLKKAGTAILAICIVLWWLSAYPQAAPPAEAGRLREQASALRAAVPEAPSREEEAASLETAAAALESRHALSSSFAGRMGRAIQPIFAPLGYDWQLSIGVMASFAAREVFVSTMAVLVAGSDDAEDRGVLEQLAQAKKDDGTPMLSVAVCWSLLIYYVLAMQCLPTLAVTARESGHVKWALLQLAWMSGLAYLSALVVFQVLS